MTQDSTQPCFGLTPGHLQNFSRQMTDMADRQRAWRSIDILPVPAASSRWAAVAAMDAEDVVVELMEQICDRGATAVEHLWPVLPSHALIESRLRQMMPDKVHVLRRMLRDGPWPGQGAKVMAPLSLPPLPSRHAQTAPTALSLSMLSDAQSPAADTAAATISSASQGNSSRMPSPSSAALPALEREEVKRRSPSTRLTTAHVMQIPTISRVAPARPCATQQAELEPVKAPKHVSWESSHESSASPSASDQSLSVQSASVGTSSSSTNDSQTLSDINAKIAVLSKWGQPLPASPQLLEPHQAASSSRQTKRSSSWPRLKRHAVPEAEQLSVSVSHADSAPREEPLAHAAEHPRSLGMPLTEAHAAAVQAPGQGQPPQQRPPGVKSMPALHSTSMVNSAVLHPMASQTPSPQPQHQPQRAGLPTQESLQKLQLPLLLQGLPPPALSSPVPPQAVPQSLSQQSQGAPPQAAPHTPQPRFPLQMWPHVKKYALPQSLTASPASTQPDPKRVQQKVSGVQKPNTSGQAQQQARTLHSARFAGSAASPSTPSSALPAPVMRSTTAPASSFNQMLTDLPAAGQLPANASMQPQTPLLARTHRHVRSQEAISSRTGGAEAHETRIRAGHTARTRICAGTDAPDWSLQQGANSRHSQLGDSPMWQTPQLPYKWSGQGTCQQGFVSESDHDQMPDLSTPHICCSELDFVHHDV